MYRHKQFIGLVQQVSYSLFVDLWELFLTRFHLLKVCVLTSSVSHICLDCSVPYGYDNLLEKRKNVNERCEPS